MLSLTGKETLLEQMLLIRAVEDRLQELCNEGLAGDLHFSRGQEAIAVGVCAAMRPTDYLVTHHRTIAHAIAKGVPLEPLLAEILGKPNGLNGGLAGEMHLSCPEKRFMFSWQLVGTCIPVAAGMAWAVKNYRKPDKIRAVFSGSMATVNNPFARQLSIGGVQDYTTKTDDVVVCFHGDAATANGQWHEGVNIAAVQHLPLLLVCENNHLAGNVRPKHYQPVGSVHQRMEGYGLSGITVDGNDIEEVREQAEIALRIVRRFGKPYMLECDTTRLGRHKQGQGDLRSKEEIAKLSEWDPLRDVTLEERKAVEARVTEIIQKVQAGEKC